MKRIINFIIKFLLLLNPFRMEAVIKKKKQKSSLSMRITNMVRSIMSTPENFMSLWQLVRITPFQNKLRRMGRKNGGVSCFAMMALPNPNQVVTGYLNFPGPKNENVPHARQMSHDISVSPDITTAPAVLLLLDGSIDAYAGAHGADLVPTYREMVKQFDAILLIYNLFANELINRPMAISILQNGGFHVKGAGGSHASVFGVRNSVISGEMLLTQPTLAGCSYEWWYSSDGINYVRIQSSSVNHTTLGGLTPGKSAWFKCQHIVGNNAQGLSDPIERLVK
jgi:hypothetical protein